MQPRVSVVEDGHFAFPVGRREAAREIGGKPSVGSDDSSRSRRPGYLFLFGRSSSALIPPTGTRPSVAFHEKLCALAVRFNLPNQSLEGFGPTRSRRRKHDHAWVGRFTEPPCLSSRGPVLFLFVRGVFWTTIQHGRQTTPLLCDLGSYCEMGLRCVFSSLTPLEI